MNRHFNRRESAVGCQKLHLRKDRFWRKAAVRNEAIYALFRNDRTSRPSPRASDPVSVRSVSRGRFGPIPSLLDRRTDDLDEGVVAIGFPFISVLTWKFARRTWTNGAAFQRKEQSTSMLKAATRA